MKEYTHPIGYLEMLKRRREAAQARKAATPKPPTLHDRVQSWYNGLSDEEKSRAYTMKEFRALFGDSPQKLGAALFDLGWTRKRMWRDDLPTARYWYRCSGREKCAQSESL